MPTPTVALDKWEDELCALIRARQPGIVLQSVEEGRALTSVTRVLQWIAQKGLGVRELHVWSAVTRRIIDVCDPDNDENTNNKTMPGGEFFKVVNDFRADHGDEKNPTRRVLVLADAGHLLGAANNLRLLRETLWEIRGSFRTVIFIGLPFNIPPEIAPDLNVLPFELPDAKLIEKTIGPIIESYKSVPGYSKLKFDATLVSKFSRACAGLTQIEAQGLLGLAIARFSAFDMRAVDMALKEKAQIVRRSNVLDYRVPTGGLDKVGGLQNIKTWIKELDTTYTSPELARAAGVAPASGMMLIGVPGTGKTLLGNMVAAHWNLPLLVFDVSRAFGGIVGQSEANVDQVFTLAKACRPCVVFIDEVEKALGGAGGELDGGTSSRVKGKIMSWMQDKPEDIFVVATANDVTKFDSEPAFLRAGRFDVVSFVDLPDLRSRLEILAIQYKNAVEYAKAGEVAVTLPETIDADTLMEAAKSTKGYSGAELRTVMQKALRTRAATKTKKLSSEMLVTAASGVRPLSITMSESIERLRSWVKEGRAVPAGATLEDDKADAKAFQDFGLPQIVAE